MRLPCKLFSVLLLAIATTPVTAGDVSHDIAKAREWAEQGKHQAAIQLLEQILPNANGNPQVLSLLRDFYEIEIRKSSASGDTRWAETLGRRLKLLEPAVTEPVPSNPAAASPSAVRVKLLGIDAAGVPSSPPATGTDTERKPVPESASHALLRQANALFQSRRFAEAGRLYGKLHESAPEQMEVVKDRWAYCRLVSVANRINNGQESRADSIDEIRAIALLIPKSAYPETLLERFQEHGVSTPPASERLVRAKGPEQSARGGLLAGLASRIGLGMKQDSGFKSFGRKFRSGQWQVLETANFRVHYKDEQLSGPVADVAERARIELYRTWFGHTPQSNWNPKCDVYLHPSGAAYARATGQGPASPGHSSTQIQRGRVIARRVDLRQDGPDVVTAILPHEITHVVMADRFTHRALPRWADEGVAVLSEPVAKKTAHLKNLDRLVQRGRIYSARELMTMNDYPPGEQWPLFYSESVSLVQFLIDRGGPTQFMDFMSGALQRGYESELRRVYGLKSFEELDRAWAGARTIQLAEAKTGTGAPGFAD